MTAVKNISIKSFLARRGILPRRERGGYGMYLSPLREERTPSFKVDYEQNLWYDFGLGEGGSIIDLVARMENYSIGEAIRRLERGAEVDFLFHRDNSVPPQSSAPIDSRITIVSATDLKHSALIGYLHERGIDISVARKYCHEVNYRIGEREYFAIGFKNDAGGRELRNRNFKGSSSPKNITTIRGCRSGDTMTSTASDTVMVFEGFIDFLSYLSLKQNPTPEIDTVVLNSVINLYRAMPFLAQHKTIHAFLDNDDVGRKALGDMRELLPLSDVVDQSIFYKNHKDLNEYWREQSIQREPPKPKIKRGRGI